MDEDCRGCFENRRAAKQAHAKVGVANKLVARAKRRMDQAEAREKRAADKIKALEEDNLMLKSQLQSLAARAHAYKREAEERLEMVAEAECRLHNAGIILEMQKQSIVMLEKKIAAI